MPLPFLSGATGDPINLQRQLVGQALRTIPTNLPESGGTGWRDFRSNGGPVIFTPGEIDRMSISGGGQPQGNLPGKINIEDIPFEIGDVDPANYGMLLMMLNLFGLYTLTDNTTWQEWNISLAEATPYDPFLTYREWNDVNPGFRLTDLLVGGLDLTVAPNENLQIIFNAVAAEFDYHGAVTQESGTGSDVPVLKRFWGNADDDSGNWALDATDQDIFIQVDEAADLDISGKVTDGASYSNTQVDEVPGQFHRLYDESGLMIGKFAEQIRYLFPASPTLTAADEFKILKRMAKWNPSLGADRPITSVNTQLILDGVETRTEGGWTVAGSWENTELVLDVAGRQGGTVRRSGDLGFVIEPTREVVDLVGQEAILSARQVSLVIEAVTDVEIGASGRPFRFLQIYPQCRVFGSTFGVEAGGQNRQETLRLVPEEPESALSYDGGSYDAHAHIVIENDIAAP
jgi:hypothetical protein